MPTTFSVTCDPRLMANAAEALAIAGEKTLAMELLAAIEMRSAALAASAASAEGGFAAALAAAEDAIASA